MQYKYDLRGVSATKDEVHAAIKHMDKGLYPMAFCKIMPDVVGGSEEHCNIMHADTAGTKTSLAYLYWRETGDLSVWKGIAQDALVMNLDDMACVGCTDGILVSSTIGRNKNLIPGEVIATLIQAAVVFVENMAAHGIGLHLSGGETADVGDIVRTLDVGYTTFARMKRNELIVNDIKAGDVIVGLASHGQASYETEYNGGMGSNGLTSARHDVFSKIYADKYPDSFDPNTPSEVIYTGSKRLTDTIEISGQNIPIGKLVLSPTRTYLPVIKKVLDEFSGERRRDIHGLVHCSGGGQTKVKHFLKNKRVVKDNLMPIPPLFDLIKKESGTGRREMYQVFNMGQRLEFYLGEKDAQAIIDIAHSFDIDAQVVGYVEAMEGEQVLIKSEHRSFEY
ncbi:MAG: phosphoribosylformylglycinamidine cyclo-ligase [Saprospiraceae bacterium]|nr:phosphoribosylformylglycinamidine cyclo-ligase [Saprospiraceae bacterium]MCF8250419.1 phosphoribosylformylglycinamidine cyclo-ligase [Saprospiraceae bacterium]MCF8312206.1 phosphoribosylformylglycinamidine cyclo-ligase [Saprospiraceae bacterium]MCF8440547.1 phosphoribosylformylglycinamidine cyclo-ligase [Saprospiraceae bacterium]